MLESPKVKDAIAKILEQKLREPMPKHIAEGWEKVRKGVKCVYPGCNKKAECANFHGYPLCQEHHDLSQWIGIIIFDDVYSDEMHKDNLARTVQELELVVKQFMMKRLKK